MKLMRIRRSILIVIVLSLLQVSPVFASTHRVEGYFVPYGTVPNFGLASWGINVAMNMDYSAGSLVTLNYVDCFVWISPKRVDEAGNGAVTGNVRERINNGAWSTTVSLSSLPWTDVWTDPSDYYYHSRFVDSGATSSGSVSEQIYVAFGNNKASWLFDTTYTLTGTVYAL